MLRCLVLLVLGLTVIAQVQRPTFRTSVAQVHVDTEVLTNDGRIVSGLSKNDFRVLDEGKEQPIVGFAAELQPLDLVLLFDLSGSMRSHVAKVAAVARKALQELRKGDGVSVRAFHTKTFFGTPFITNLDAVAVNIERIQRLQFGGGTNIRRAIDAAATRISEEPRGSRRRAILIITDDVGLKTLREMTVVRHLWEADTVLSGLLVKPGFLSRRPWRIGGMKGIAAKTGGDTVITDDLDSALPEMMRRLRSRYSLYYNMPGGTPGSYRSIEVTLAQDAQQRLPGARIYARRGYRLTLPQ